MSDIQRRADYRGDIDGLRALAVLAVIAFHIWPQSLPGGFLGVDVFFVISGYLITRLALAEVAQGRFDWRAFYERRARRILPALLVMLLGSLLAGWVWMHAEERQALGASAAAAILWSANLYFWKNTGYFQEAANSYALLHTWSLGVEEQFYFAFPLLLWLQRRWGWKAVGAALLLSLGAYAVTSSAHSSASFFLLPMRAWELMAGCLIAREEPPSRSVAGLQSWWAVSALLLCFLLANEANRMPASVLAVGLTAWILWGGAPMLQWRPLAAIGLVSYSLYLWHQPVLVFASLHLDRHLRTDDVVVVLPLMFLMAWASWRWVETPFRKAGPRAPFVRLAIATSLGLLAVTCALWQRGGTLAARPPAQEALLRASYDYKEPYGLNRCFLNEFQSAQDFEDCRTLGSGVGTAVLWGDSYAAHWMPGLRSRPALYRELIQRTVSGCAPQLVMVDALDRCDALNQAIWASIVKSRPQRLILSGRWNESSLSSLPPLIEAARGLGVEVIVLGPTPRWRGGIRGLLLDDGADHEHLPARLTMPHGQPLKRLSASLQSAAETAGARYFELLSPLCDPDMRCRVSQDGRWQTAFIWDDGHLTSVGSQLLAGRLAW